MQLHQFLSRVQDQAGLESPEQAMHAAQATLEVLSERLQGGQPKDLGSQLPQLLKSYLHEGQGHRFDPDEFFRRVADREGVDQEAGRQHAQAVLRTIEQAVDRGEMEHLMSQLPQAYRNLFSNNRERPS